MHNGFDGSVFFSPDEEGGLLDLEMGSTGPPYWTSTGDRSSIGDVSSLFWRERFLPKKPEALPYDVTLTRAEHSFLLDKAAPAIEH